MNESDDFEKLNAILYFFSVDASGLFFIKAHRFDLIMKKKNLKNL